MYETLNKCEEKRKEKKNKDFLLTGKKKFSCKDIRYGSIWRIASKPDIKKERTKEEDKIQRKCKRYKKEGEN